MYKISFDGLAITRLSDNASVPIDPGNRDYRAYLEYAARGGAVTTEPAPVASTRANVAQDRLANDYLLNALVTALAAKLGTTPAVLNAAIVAQVTLKEANDHSQAGNAPPHP